MTREDFAIERHLRGQTTTSARSSSGASCSRAALTMTSKAASLVDLERVHSGHGLAAHHGDVVLEYGDGAVVVTADEDRYIDLFAGAGRCIIGHGPGRFSEAVAAQANRLVVSRHTTAVAVGYVERLLSLVPSELDHVTFFSTGSEAVDAAVRLARAFTAREDVVVFERAFHGRTAGTSPLTHPVPWTRPHACTNVHRVGYPVGDKEGTTAENVLLEIRRHHEESGLGLAAIVIEPIQGTGGNRPPVPGFLATLSDLCTELGALMIADEIVTGFGRTGAMFVSPDEGLRADIITIGKGMGNGFPISGMLASSNTVGATSFSMPGALSSTFGGNPLAMAAAAATLDVIVGDGLAEAALTNGSAWLSELSLVLSDIPVVTSVHGRGLMIGVKLRIPPDSPRTRLLDRALLDQNLLVGVSGDMLRINPPLTITPEQASRATAALAAALASPGWAES